jgi:hypothetical protein
MWKLQKIQPYFLCDRSIQLQMSFLIFNGRLQFT